MRYQVKILESVEKKLAKTDRQLVRVIKNWIVKNIVDTENPREKGKPLKGKLKDIWRYRMGDYRLFAKIDDDELIVFLFELGHKSEIYKKH